MYPQINQRPTASLLLVHKPAAQARNARAAHPVGFRIINTPQRARLNILFHPLHIAPVAMVERNHQDAIVGAGSFDHGAALDSRARKRFFYQHMLTRLKRSHRHRQVQCIRQTYTHRINIRRGQQIGIFAEGLRHAILGGHTAHPVIIKPGQRSNFNPWQLAIACQVHFTNPRADHPDA